MSGSHFEPYLMLAEVRPTAALVAWGGFWFESDRRSVTPSSRRSIGAGSEPHGASRVEAFTPQGRLAAAAETSQANHAWLEGLEPDTPYRYRVLVDGVPWAEGQRFDWSLRTDRLELGGRYENVFRTHPAPDQATELSFAALGGYGVGIRGDSKSAHRQRRLALALAQLTTHEDLRCLVTTGDGAESDASNPLERWFFSFYQPYRYLINRIPIYPTVGDEARRREDVLHFYLRERFATAGTAHYGSVDPGVFYRVRLGKSMELVSLDTHAVESGEAAFTHPRHQPFVDAAFPAGGDGTPWRIPVSHHPVFSAGPVHENHPEMFEHLVPRFERAGVRMALAGREHNFQYSEYRGVRYLVTGAGGELHRARPERFEDAHTVAWGAGGHVLLLRAGHSHLEVAPVSRLDDGSITELVPTRPDGRALAVPFSIPVT